MIKFIIYVDSSIGFMIFGRWGVRGWSRHRSSTINQVTYQPNAWHNILQI